MAPPAWLPPVNSHENYTIHVKASERPVLEYTQNPENFKSKAGIEIERVFYLEVKLDFYSEDDVNMENTFPGFSRKIFTFLLFDPNTPEILAEQLEITLDDDMIPFPLNSYLWTEHHLHDDCPSSPLQLSGENKLIEKILNFIHLMDDKPDNHSMKFMAMNLEIEKSVMVPAEEFGSWVSWYDEQKRVNPKFEEEYMEAICSPRLDSEVSEEAESLIRTRSASRTVVERLESVLLNNDDDVDSEGLESKKESCCICLEEFSDGLSTVTQLPCQHTFHGDCIVRWLRGNHVCPICRHPLPVD